MDASSYIPVGIICTRYHINLSEELLPLLESHCHEIRVVVSVVTDNAELSDAEASSLQSVEILIADPRIVQRLSLSFPNLKWMHTLWAGVDALVKSADRTQIPTYIITRNGKSFVEAMAQYVIGYILAHERHHRLYDQNQRSKMWKSVPYRRLSTMTLGILGLGIIGKEVARLAKSMNMTVWGSVRVLPIAEQRSEHVNEYRLVNELPELLSACDYVCSVLPSTTDTDGLLDGDMLSHCRNKKSVFMNIGRGNVVKNSTIVHALDQGWLEHAVLDVLESEPLPEDSELWTRSDVTITPHDAGVGIDAKEFAEEFATNFKLFRNGDPMNYVVDWTKGY